MNYRLGECSYVYIFYSGKIFVLGRCRKCVINKRTITYCRNTMLHTEFKAECCLKCLEVGYNMTKCRVELHHQNPNGTKRMSIGTTGSEHEVAYSILNLPQCCLKLEGLHITVPVDVSTLDLGSCTKLSHVTGFMLEYSETKWENWFSSYCQHSNTRYSIHTGKQINKKQEHGVYIYVKKILHLKLSGLACTTVSELESCGISLVSG